MEKLRDAKDVKWTESYTDRTEYLKNQFEDIIGKRSYCRWEGEEVDGPGKWYVVVSPADVHEHKRAKFFAGIRKLPDSYPAGGKYFDTIKEAYEYAFETWGTPIPKNVPTYTSGDLKGISKKIKQWEKKEEKKADFDIFFIKQGMARGLVTKEHTFFNIECFDRIIAPLEQQIRDRILNPQSIQRIKDFIIQNREILQSSQSSLAYREVKAGITQLMSELYGIDVYIHPYTFYGWCSMLKNILANGGTNIDNSALDYFLSSFFKENNPINHPWLSEELYKKLLESSGYFGQGGREDIASAEKYVIDLLSRRFLANRGRGSFKDEKNLAFIDHSYRPENKDDCSEQIRLAAEISVSGRASRKAFLANSVKAEESTSGVESIPGYNAISSRSLFEDGILSTYRSFRKEQKNIEQSYDMSYHVWFSQYRSEGSYADFIRACDSQPGYAESHGLVKSVDGGRWNLSDKSKYPMKVFVSFGLNDSSVHTIKMSPYNSQRHWGTQINFSKFSLDDYRDENGFSSIELSFLYALDKRLFGVSKKSGHKEEIVSNNIEKARQLLSSPNIQKAIDQVTDYLKTGSIGKKFPKKLYNNHFTIRQLDEAFDVIKQIVSDNGIESPDIFVAALKKFFAGWVVFLAGESEKFEDWKMEIKAKESGAFYGGTRAMHDAFSNRRLLEVLEMAEGSLYDTVSVSASTLASIIPSFESDDIDQESLQKFTALISELHSMSDKKIDRSQFKYMVSNHGLQNVFGAKKIALLYSQASVSGSKLPKSQSSGKSKNDLGYKVKIKVRNALYYASTQKGWPGIPTIQEHPEVLTDERYEDVDRLCVLGTFFNSAVAFENAHGGVNMVDYAIANHKGEDIPVVKLRRILMDLHGQDTKGNTVPILSEQEVDELIAGYQATIQGVASQYVTKIEAEDCILSTFENSLGVKCPYIKVRDYLYWKIMKDTISNAWGIRLSDPNLYEAVLRLFFTPPELKDQVNQIPLGNSQANIDQIETLIEQYFSDPSTGESRKRTYSINNMATMNVSESVLEQIKKEYPQLLPGRGKFVSSESFTGRMQLKILHAFAKDLTTEIEGGGKSAVVRGAEMLDEGAYQDLLDELSGALESEQELVSVGQEIFNIIDKFSTEHSLPVDMKKRPRLRKPFMDSMSFSGVRLSKSANLGTYGVCIGGDGIETKDPARITSRDLIPITTTDTISSNPANEAVACNFSFSEFVSMFALQPQMHDLKGVADLPGFREFTSHTMAGSLLASTPDFKAMPSEQKMEQISSLQNDIFSISTGSLYDRLVRALSDAVSIRSGTRALPYDVFFYDPKSPNSSSMTWYDAYQNPTFGDKAISMAAIYIINWIITKSLPSLKKGKKQSEFTAQMLGQILGNQEIANSIFVDMGYTIEAVQASSITENQVAEAMVSEQEAEDSSEVAKNSEQAEKEQKEEVEAQKVREETEKSQKEISTVRGVVQEKTSRGKTTYFVTEGSQTFIIPVIRGKYNISKFVGKDVTVTGKTKKTGKDRKSFTEVASVELSIAVSKKMSVSGVVQEVTDENGAKVYTLTEQDGTRVTLTSGKGKTDLSGYIGKSVKITGQGKTTETGKEITKISKIEAIEPPGSPPSGGSAATPAAEQGAETGVQSEPAIEQPVDTIEPEAVAPQAIAPETAPSQSPVELEVKRPPVGAPAAEEIPAVPIGVKPTIERKPAPIALTPTREDDGEQIFLGKKPKITRKPKSLLPTLEDDEDVINLGKKKDIDLNIVRVPGKKAGVSTNSLLNLLRVAEIYARKGLVAKADAINEYVKISISQDVSRMNKTAIVNSMSDLLKVSSELQKEGKFSEAQEINSLVKKYMDRVGIN